jgi:hypothetical protein
MVLVISPRHQLTRLCRNYDWRLKRVQNINLRRSGIKIQRHQRCCIIRLQIILGRMIHIHFNRSIPYFL